MDEPTKVEPETKSPIKEESELNTEYANTVFLAPTLLDLKMIFGENEVFPGQGYNFHTSITIPWAAAKILQYYLATIVTSHEMDQGSIQIPKQMTPKPPEPPPVSRDANPLLWRHYEVMNENYHKFFTSQKSGEESKK
jgi:hypothetical protein